MQPTDEAILRTILYSDVFNFPLKLEEIHHFLIYERTVTYQEIRCRLETSDMLKEALTHISPFYALHGRTDIIERRQAREHSAATLLETALFYGRWLSRLPFVRMVAVTGSLAVRNPRTDHDDLDYFLVVEPGRVWLTRAFAILLVRVGRVYGVEICPNYVLASDQLTQRRQDLFIAREITQMIPIYGLNWYAAFREANAWANTYQPNATHPLYGQATLDVGRWNGPKQFSEWLLGGALGEWLERWEFQRKQRRFQSVLQPGTDTRAEIDTGQVKGHFVDHGTTALRAYTHRLAAYGLADETTAPANLKGAGH